jgi:recombination protein RecA
MVSKNSNVTELLAARYSGFGIPPELTRIPTGLAPLDWSLGGGLPKGRIIQLFGAGGSGKSTLTLNISAALLPEHKVALIDLERTNEIGRVSNVLGDKINNLMFLSTSDPEEVFSFIEDPDVDADLIIIDSAPYLLPQEEVDKKLGDKQKIGAGSSLWSTLQTRLTKLLHENDSCLILINQERSNLAYGADFKPWGGYTLNHISSYIGRVSKGIAKIGGGSIIKISTRKNKLFNDGIVYEIFVDKDSGKIDFNTTNVVWLASVGICRRTGAHVIFNDKAVELLSLEKGNVGNLQDAAEYLATVPLELKRELYKLALV